MRGVYSKSYLDRIQSFLGTINKSGRCWFSSLKCSHWYTPVGIRRGTQVGGHRLSWFIANGPIKAGTFICHHCDEPLCLNPVHLYAGTNRDNLLDRVQRPDITVSPCKPRGSAGDRNPNHKLTSGRVKLIRALFSTGRRSCAELSRTFRIEQSAISAILRGKSWVSV